MRNVILGLLLAVAAPSSVSAADLTQQGVAANQAITLNARQAASYNALNQTYGPPIAYDPVNAFNAAKASVVQQTIPTEVQPAALSSAGSTLCTKEEAKEDADMERLARDHGYEFHSKCN